ncbi:MAG: peptidoglycan DD-metalloendopeptidase family protein [Candidatus Cryosericum sp.]|nr:peptidoglycan DD-metalloendopeptidase family protein [bacterium]
MKLLKIGITILLIVALLISGSVVIPGVEGDLTSDLKAAQQKMNQLKAQLQEIQRQISANKSAKYSLLSQLSSLNDQMEEMQSEIESINSRIVSLQNTLAKTAAQIADKEKQIDALSEQTNASINLLYHVSNLDVSGLPFSGGSLSTTVEAQQAVSSILRQITASLSAVNTQKLALQSDRTSYAQTKSALENVYALKKQQAALLADQKAAKEQTLDYLAAKGSQYANDDKRIQNEIAKENKLIDQIVAEINRQKHPGSAPTGKLSWPIPGSIHITELFGMRHDPINGAWEMHNGIDMGCATGTTLLAPADGVVEYEGRFSGYGNMLMLQCGQNMTLVFGHLKSFIAKKGQSVKRGQVIALTDNTGWSTGPHLHFEVRIDGTPKNPLVYLGPKP